MKARSWLADNERAFSLTQASKLVLVEVKEIGGVGRRPGESNKGNKWLGIGLILEHCSLPEAFSTEQGAFVCSNRGRSV